MMDKIKYYSQKKVAETYLDERYSGKSGSYINKRELSAVKSILPSKGSVLDVACGVGRLSVLFQSPNYMVTGLDSSKEMLKKCPYKSKKIGNALKLPFKDNSFDLLITTRFLHHYENPEIFLKEFKRVIKQGGSIIFETYRWSLKKYYFNRNKGGKIYIHQDKKINKILNNLNLQLKSKKSILLFSPFIYKHLPYFMIEPLNSIEKYISNRLRYSVFWRVVKE